MSDNKLRDRIERQLCMFFDEGYDGHLFDASQAIIDDLGLEWSRDGAWAEGYDAGSTDSSNYEDVRDGHAYYDDYEETPNPYGEDR